MLVVGGAQWEAMKKYKMLETLPTPSVQILVSNTILR